MTWSLSANASNGNALIDASTGVSLLGKYRLFTDGVTVQVSDGSLTATLTVDLTLTPVNDAPVIVQGDGPLNQTILEDANLSLALNATDVDGDALTWSVSSAAGNGTAGVDANTGEVTYHPNADFFGSDSFTVSVSDGSERFGDGEPHH